MRLNGIGFGPKQLFFCAEQIRAKPYHFKRREHQEYQIFSFPEFQKLVQNRHLKKVVHTMHSDKCHIILKYVKV